MPLVTCRDLSLGYDGRAILRDLNFSVSSAKRERRILLFRGSRKA